MTGEAALAELRAMLAAWPGEIGADACAGWFAWRGGGSAEPWCEYGPRFDELWAALRRAGALDESDYMRWPGLADYESGRRRMADAPRGDIAKWLFAVYRQERFVTGLWAKQLRQGRLKDAIARWVALNSEGE